MSSPGIPRKLGQIWIGPGNPPSIWMNSWKEKHPDWDYTLYDNDYLLSRRWRCQRQIARYYRRGRYEGVADLMRYEILFEQGGLIAPADSTCLRNCGELFERPALYSVWENEKARPGYLSPFCASTPGHPFLEEILEELSGIHPMRLKRPWKSVGNRFLGRFYRERNPDNVVILSSSTFNPVHFGTRGEPLPEEGEVYAIQHWGTTTGSYRKVCEPRSQREMKRINRRIIRGLDARLRGESGLCG